MAEAGAPFPPPVVRRWVCGSVKPVRKMGIKQCTETQLDSDHFPGNKNTSDQSEKAYLCISRMVTMPALSKRRKN